METGIHELTAGYALDALDPVDREAFERHLARCEQCQEELASFWEVTSALAVGADGPAPNRALRERILADVRAEQQTVVPLESRRRLSPVVASVTAIAAAAAIGLGIYSASLHGQLGDTRVALAGQKNVAAVLTDPTARTVALEAGSGRVIVARGGSAVLVLEKANPLPSGKTYQAWVIGSGRRPQPAGTFEPTNGRAVVEVGLPVPAKRVAAVTVEDAGGVATPTLPLASASKPV